MQFNGILLITLMVSTVLALPPMGKITDMFNPYKMFWEPQNTSKCELTGVVPMQWYPPSDNPLNLEYMLVDGDPTGSGGDPENYKRSWNDAQDYCVSQNGSLAMIKSQAANDFVWCLAPSLENRWIGLTISWLQSQDFAAMIAAGIGPGPGVDNFGEDIQIFEKAKIRNKDNVLVDSSAVLRKGRRTAGSRLLGGTYADGSTWLPQDFDTTTTMIYGNPKSTKPYTPLYGSRKLQVPWYTMEPNNRRGAENCIEMGKAWQRQAPKGQWNDFNCDYEKAFVCERVKV